MALAFSDVGGPDERGRERARGRGRDDGEEKSDRRTNARVQAVRGPASKVDRLMACKLIGVELLRFADTRRRIGNSAHARPFFSFANAALADLYAIMNAGFMSARVDAGVTRAAGQMGMLLGNRNRIREEDVRRVLREVGTFLCAMDNEAADQLARIGPSQNDVDDHWNFKLACKNARAAALACANVLAELRKRSYVDETNELWRIGRRLDDPDDKEIPLVECMGFMYRHAVHTVLSEEGLSVAVSDSDGFRWIKANRSRLGQFNGRIGVYGFNENLNAVTGLAVALRSILDAMRPGAAPAA